MYERFRQELIAKLCRNFSPAQLQQIANALDVTAEHYKVDKAEMELTTLNDASLQLVHDYIAIKSIEGLSAGTLKGYRYALENFFFAARKAPEKVSRILAHQQEL